MTSIGTGCFYLSNLSWLEHYWRVDVAFDRIGVSGSAPFFSYILSFCNRAFAKVLFGGRILSCLSTQQRGVFMMTTQIALVWLRSLVCTHVLRLYLRSYFL